jgi:hypothetical protein
MITTIFVVIMGMFTAAWLAASACDSFGCGDEIEKEK